MADAPAETTPAEKAGEAVEAVETQIATVKDGAQAAIDAARAETDAATAAATEISRAALATDLGARIESVQKDNETWRNQYQARVEPELAKVSNLEKQVTELQAGLGLILGALKPASPSPSTPPASGTPPANPNPTDPNASGDAPAAPPPQPRPTLRKHLL